MFPRADRDHGLPLSFAQQGLWLVQQLLPRPEAYNLSMTYGVEGRLDGDLLRASLAELQGRHEPLRTCFRQEVGGADPVQVVTPPEATVVPLEVHDLRDTPAGARLQRARHLAACQARLPFDVERAPLWRVGLLTLADDDHLLVLTLHHLVADGWSIPILLDELTRSYSSLRRRLPSPLAPLPVQYADYAAWQRTWLTGPRLDELLEHWLGRLAGAAPTLALPADRPRPTIASHAGDAVEFVIPPADVRRLERVAQRLRATPYMLLLGAFEVLLHRSTGETDLVVGTPVANRGRSEAEHLVGLLVNTLVMRTDLSGDPTFAELVARVRRTVLEALDHQDLPFERLVEELRPARSRGHHPVFQVLFAMADLEGRYEQPGLIVRTQEPVRTATAKFDLALMVYRRADRLRCAAEYATDLFDRRTIERLVDRLLALLAAALDEPRTRLSRLRDEGADPVTSFGQAGG